ncbi:oogenesin-1-like [Acomys russatus]|uniref:oogenesin-1-like n=1 Tax=Acomys russatus TaxID=60746 RepID=UPI0021E2D086|nr:oogenesin-1-like [Acomys russatus]
MPLRNCTNLACFFWRCARPPIRSRGLPGRRTLLRSVAQGAGLVCACARVCATTVRLGEDQGIGGAWSWPVSVALRGLTRFSRLVGSGVVESEGRGIGKLLGPPAIVSLRGPPPPPPPERFVTVTHQAPSTLLELAKQSLLREEALAIPALEDLSTEPLQAVLEEAFTNRYTEILRAIVSSWPSPCLSVGALIVAKELDVLKAVLEGVHVLTAQGPSRRQLRVLDLRNAPHDAWSRIAGSYEDECLPKLMTQKPPVESCPDSGLKSSLKVIADLKLQDRKLDEWDACLLQWARQHQGSTHLCCRKLLICDQPSPTLTDIFKSVDPACIQELHLTCLCMEELAFLEPYLEQMKNLSTLTLGLFVYPFPTDYPQELIGRIYVLSFQLSQLHCLRNLCLNNLKAVYVPAVHFIRQGMVDSVHKEMGDTSLFLQQPITCFLPRCLEKPLETLSIICCHLSQADLDYLPHCLTVGELKHLDLSATRLGGFFVKPLGLLLERVRGTLQTLNMGWCSMRDSQVCDLLSGLSQCSQLTKVSFAGNKLSLPALKQLLHHTARLSQLSQELYPAPLDCYDDMGDIRRDKFVLVCPDLLDILRAKRQPKRVCFNRSQFINSHECLVYNLET